MTFEIRDHTLLKYEGNEESIELPQDIETIGDFAFANAKSLKHIQFTDYLQEIGTNAFYNCESLEEIELPDSVYYMDTAVFSRCSNLKRVKLSNSLTSVPKITFFQCHNLSEVVLPNRLTVLRRACFEQCSSLKHIDLPDTLKTIEQNVFDACYSLKQIVLPAGLKSIGENAFYECHKMKSVNIPEHIESIGKGAFETRGRIAILGNDQILMKPAYFDNNWNMNWNFGSNHRYNGKNEENYQFVNSYLPNVDLKMWKPHAQCVLAVNYLETKKNRIDYYDAWINAHKDELMEMIVSMKRYDALNCALDHELLNSTDVEPYLDRIYDRDEKALLLNRKPTSKIDDLFDLL